jgi:hypothetical protein
MDDFKKNSMKMVGPGGVTCPCCNLFFGKKRKKLNRIARSRTKHILRIEFRNQAEK